ncbi:MAG: hypothetical protein H7Y38_10420, partial [Armatimonadetes bacterium]|nr:hypothetical protein [Armatimonadota bacterium]
GETLRVPDDVLLYMARLVQSNIRTLEGALVKLVAYASLTNSQVTTQMAEGILEKYFIAAGAGLAGGSAERGGAVGGSSLFVPDGKGFSGYGMNAGMTNSADAARTPPRTVDRFAAPERLPYVPKAMRPAPVLPLAPPASAPAPSYAPAYTAPVAVAAPLAASGEKLSAELIFRVVANQFGVTTDDLGGKKRDRDVTNARQVAMHLLRELTDMSLPGIGQLFGGRDHTTVIHACDRVKAQLDEGNEMRELVAGLVAEMHRAKAQPASLPENGKTASPSPPNPPDRRSGLQTIERPFDTGRMPV